MPRKNRPDSSNEEPTTKPPVDEIEGDAAAPIGAAEPKREYVKRADPFGFESFNWADGYRISLQESDSNREIFVQFGKGARSDQPKAFDAIKKVFKEAGMYWDAKVQGWAKGLKPGQTPLIKEQNRRTRTTVEEAFYKAVALEEGVRGPSLSEHAREHSGVGR